MRNATGAVCPFAPADAADAMRRSRAVTIAGSKCAHPPTRRLKNVGRVHLAEPLYRASD